MRRQSRISLRFIRATQLHHRSADSTIRPRISAVSEYFSV
jgi:hypothetical protein